MKIATAAINLFLLAGSAAWAFYPAVIHHGRTAISVSVQMTNSNYDNNNNNNKNNIDEAFGVTFETGNRCPPLGAKLLEDTSPNAIKWFQNAEIKHGRIAMIATVGFLVQKYGIVSNLLHHFAPRLASDSWMLSPSAGISFLDIAQATPLDAIQMIPGAGWLQIIFVAGWFEIAAFQQQWNPEQENPIPGNYGYDPFGFTTGEDGWDSDDISSYRIKEIKNGRLAMIAIAGWVANEAIPGAIPFVDP